MNGGVRSTIRRRKDIISIILSYYHEDISKNLREIKVVFIVILN